MYSAVLMLALTAGSESVDFGNRCHGCTATATKCSSAKPAATCSTSCSRGGLFANLGHGCTRSRCSTTPVASHGCTASRGCTASHGCQGGGLLSGLFNRGCSKSHGCAASCSSSAPAKKDMPKGDEKPKGTEKPKSSVQTAAPATIIVSLPADARLLVDGTATTSTSERRTLITPELQPGSTYVYTMQAQIVRNGQTITQSQDVNVTSGATANVQFTFPTQTASR